MLYAKSRQRNNSSFSAEGKKEDGGEWSSCLFVCWQTCAMRRLLNNSSISRVLFLLVGIDDQRLMLLKDSAIGSLSTKLAAYLLRFRESGRWPTSQFIHFGLSQPVEPRIQFRAKTSWCSTRSIQSPDCFCCCIMWRTWRLFVIFWSSLREVIHSWGYYHRGPVIQNLA